MYGKVGMCRGCLKDDISLDMEGFCSASCSKQFFRQLRENQDKLTIEIEFCPKCERDTLALKKKTYCLECGNKISEED